MQGRKVSEHRVKGGWIYMLRGGLFHLAFSTSLSTTEEEETVVILGITTNAYHITMLCLSSNEYVFSQVGDCVN